MFRLLSSFLSGSDQTPSNHVLDQASQQTHQWSNTDCHRYLVESQNGSFSCCNSHYGEWGGAFMGIWVPSIAPKHCGKFHFLWKPFMIRWKSIPLCSLLMTCILELTYATHKHNTLKPNPKIIESRQFKNFDSDAFIEDIKETPFPFCFSYGWPKRDVGCLEIFTSGSHK